MKRYSVTVEIVDRYWAIQVLVDLVGSPEEAMRAAETKFQEAVNLHYITGTFQATMAEEIT